MELESLEVWTVLPATPERIYAAWLDGREHALFTGGEAEVDARVGGAFRAWDGYIEGRTLELEPGRRIVQAWRSSEFPPGSADSRLEVLLAPVEDGTRVTLRHSEIPAGQGESYRQGWEDHYFAPMRLFFRALQLRTRVKSVFPPAAPTKPKAGAKKAVKRG